jgi:hypothetical protein
MTFSRQDIGVACILPSMRVTACSLCNQASEGRVAAMKIPGVPEETDRTELGDIQLYWPTRF